MRLTPAHHYQLHLLAGQLRAVASGVNDGPTRHQLRRIADSLVRIKVEEAQPAAGALAVRLTQRELDVLHLVAVGYSNARIAEDLHLTVETVKSYLRNVSCKLETGSRYESVTKARQLGLLP